MSSSATVCRLVAKHSQPAPVAQCLTMTVQISLGTEELYSETTEEERKVKEEAETLETVAQCLTMTVQTGLVTEELYL